MTAGWLTSRSTVARSSPGREGRIKITGGIRGHAGGVDRLHPAMCSHMWCPGGLEALYRQGIDFGPPILEFRVSPGGRQPGDTELLFDCYRDAEQWPPLAFSERRVRGSSGAARSIGKARNGAGARETQGPRQMTLSSA